MTNPYILTWRSDVDPGSINLVGPFTSERQATRWGTTWQANHEDNPCWQLLNLDENTFEPDQALGVQFLRLIVHRPGSKEANL